MKTLKVPTGVKRIDQPSEKTETKVSDYDNRPQLYLSSDQFSDIESMEVGDEIVLNVKVKVLRKSSTEYLTEDNRCNVDLLITAIGIEEEELEEEESDADDMSSFLKKNNFAANIMKGRKPYNGYDPNKENKVSYTH